MVTQRVGDCMVVAEFGLGQRVYHRMATDKEPGLVTGIFVQPGMFLYCVSWGDCSETRHYGFELTREYVPDFGAHEE